MIMNDEFYYFNLFYSTAEKVQTFQSWSVNLTAVQPQSTKGAPHSLHVKTHCSFYVPDIYLTSYTSCIEK
jgi:hypothetical protein